MSEFPINQVICGAFPATTRSWSSEIINMVMFSPPYWGLRDYGEATNTVWGGDPSCEHEWIEVVKLASSGSPGRETLEGGLATQNSAATRQKHISNTCIKCGAWYGQLGLEPDFRMYVEHLVEVGREIRRILRKDGSWYLNLGDTYSSQGGPQVEQTKNASHGIPPIQPNRKTNIPAKCKLMIPSRVAHTLIDDGWILRNEIIWHKRNAMPSSVKDRLNCTTEKVFHFVRGDAKSNWYIVGNKPDPRRKAGDTDEKVAARRRAYEMWCELRKWWQGGPKDKGKIPEKYLPYCMNLDYYYDLDAIREPHKTSEKEIQRGGARGRGKQGWSSSHLGYSQQDSHGGIGFAPLGKNPGDVISDSKYVGTELENNYVGTGRNPNIERMKELGMVRSERSTAVGMNPAGKNPGDFWSINTRPFPEAHFAVYPEALVERPIKSSCPPNGIVLDPMCGAGTTLKEAKRLGRRYIGIDIKPEYVEMTKRGLSQVEWPLEAYSGSLEVKL